ncbi:translational machinery component, partial [Rhizodiscina lignyota]
LHIYTHKHNTHLCLTGPFPPAEERRGPHDRRKAIMLSTGNLGFRKAQRGTFDAAFQLTAFVMNAISERDILPMIDERGLEVRFKGFGKGREAVTKALLGNEGRFLRGKIIRVTDTTTLKFGGTRSPNPRRLG